MNGGGGRFRVLVLLGALAMIGSGFLPWWRSGGDSVSGVAGPRRRRGSAGGTGARDLRRGDRGARAARHRLHARPVGVRAGRAGHLPGARAGWRRGAPAFRGWSCGRSATCPCRSSRPGWRWPRWAWRSSSTAPGPASPRHAATEVAVAARGARRGSRGAGAGFGVALAVVLLRPTLSVTSRSDPNVTIECGAGSRVDEAMRLAWGEAVLAGGPPSLTFEMDALTLLRLDRAWWGLGAQCEAAYYVARFADPVWREEIACPTG